jgi:hypothetical protein
MLKDPARFPTTPKTADDRQALVLKARLQSVADQQQKQLNVLYGLADTYSLQGLIAKGDNTLGAINDGGKGQVSHNDQDVTFQDTISGPERGRAGHATDPALSQNPAITQTATDLANNPLGRFVLAVMQNEQSTAQAENALSQSVVQTVNSCKQ